MNRNIDIAEESDDLEGQGLKNIIPSNNIDFYKRLERLLGLKLSGRTDSLTKACNLIDDIYSRGEVQNKEQNRKDLDKFNSN